MTTQESTQAYRQAGAAALALHFGLEIPDLPVSENYSIHAPETGNKQERYTAMLQTAMIALAQSEAVRVLTGSVLDDQVKADCKDALTALHDYPVPHAESVNDGAYLAYVKRLQRDIRQLIKKELRPQILAIYAALLENGTLPAGEAAKLYASATA